MKKLILILSGLVEIKKRSSYEVTNYQKMRLDFYKPLLDNQSTVYNTL